MKIKGTNLEAATIGDFKEIKSKIADKDLGLALTMVSKNLYSNPIGSFIREIASNAVDANVDANIDEAVLIHLYQEGDSYYIEFKDNGVGMTPEVFENIYMSWFNSDKRDSNDKIGGWGLGSKSPLSYQDSFEVVTRSGGIEYHYVLANEGNDPNCTLLTDNKTSSPNGTTIRIEVNSDDVYKVHRECIKQLAYFRNIYVKDDVNYYNNNFKLYESDNYILRDIDRPFGDEMHICLGQVAYPINWKVLGIPVIKLPVGVKFDIGDLDVTLSREEINYTEAVKKVILNKVELVKDTLIEKYNEQLQISSFSDYIKILRGTNRPYLKIEDVHIDMKEFPITPTFNPLPDVRFVKKYAEDLFCFYKIEELRTGRNNDRVHHNLLKYLDLSAYQSLSSYLVTGRLNTYDSLYIGSDVALLRREKVTKRDLPKMAIALDLLANKKEYLDGYNVKPIYKEGAARKIFKVIKYVDNYVYENITHYNGVASEEWIENYKREQRDLYEERKQNITHYNIYNNRTSENYGTLIDKYKAIFYISKDDTKENIVGYEYLWKQLPEYFVKNSRFLILSPSVINRMKNKPKFVPVEKIFKITEFRNTLHKIKVSKLVYEEFNTSRSIFNYSSYYTEMYRKLKRAYYYNWHASEDDVPYKSGDYTYSRDVSVDVLEHFSEQFAKIKPTKYRKQLAYEEYIEPLREVKKQLDLLNYIEVGCPHNYKVQIIETLKVLRLKPQYYKREINN